MGKAKFERSKPHVNIGTIGHIDHGKTTLTAAITKLAHMAGHGEYVAFDQIDKAPEEKEPVESRSPRHTSSTPRPNIATMHTSTALATPTTSRT